MNMSAPSGTEWRRCRCPIPSAGRGAGRNCRRRWTGCCSRARNRMSRPRFMAAAQRAAFLTRNATPQRCRCCGRPLPRPNRYLCICRGFQELNVALGGTLHQHLQEIPGRLDHRENPDVTPDEAYAPAHAVRFTPGGLLARATRRQGARVNSLHAQGVDRLAPGLTVEAEAPDGQIEAVSGAARVSCLVCSGIRNGAGPRTRSAGRFSGLFRPLLVVDFMVNKYLR